MISSWLYFIPGVIYSLFAGGLLDQFGKYRLLLFFPIFGTMLARLIMLVNYAFIETSPVEIFHLRSISSIFGGMSIYYLGYYGYSAAITAPEERAYRMALFDGSEQVRIFSIKHVGNIIFFSNLLKLSFFIFLPGRPSSCFIIVANRE